LAVGVFDGKTLAAPARTLDKATGGWLGNVLAGGDLEDKAGSLLSLYGPPGLAVSRIILVSLGKTEEFGDKAYRDALGAVAKALGAARASEAAVCLIDVEVPGRDPAWNAQTATRIIADAGYRFSLPGKPAKEAENTPKLKTVTLLTKRKVTSQVETAIKRGQAIAEGMALAKDLGNLPGNICTPSHLAQTAKDLAKQFKLKAEVLDHEAMEKLGMGALLSVARGSHEPPRFIVLQYKGGKAKEAPVVLVGKGITFDTGGISLKPSGEMDEMEYDMCGAASVLGTLKAAAMMALPLNVVGLIPTTENMPGGSATKPGDIVTSMSGQTIEVLNTDAEGRLVLCDALTYAERFKPACVVDIATLTGACVVALGKIPSGLLANDDALSAELVNRGQESGDRVWPMPLWDEYQDLLKSNFADMANTGGRYAGTITAACFLARTAKAYTWAHLDSAGTAWVSGDAKGATGRPVPLLAEFLIGRSGAK
jgi:leucyl aminopeptidase